MGDVVLALALGEVDQVQALVIDEPVDPRDERVGHRVHQGGGGKRHPPVALEEPDHTAGVHQLGLVEVQVHAVDAVELEHDVVIEHVGHSGGYGHHGLRSTQAFNGQQPLQAVQRDTLGCRI